MGIDHEPEIILVHVADFVGSLWLTIVVRHEYQWVFQSLELCWGDDTDQVSHFPTAALHPLVLPGWLCWSWTSFQKLKRLPETSGCLLKQQTNAGSWSAIIMLI